MFRVTISIAEKRDPQSCLDADVVKYQAHAYAETTKQTYCTHRRSYLSFCAKYGYVPVPASTDTLCRYVASLTHSLKYSSIKQYINIVRLLHLEWGLPNPLQNNFWLNTTLRGIRRVHGDVTVHKLPLTPDILSRIYQLLDMRNPMHTCVWAAALLMFFGLLRRSNVLPSVVKPNLSGKHLQRKDVLFHSWGIMLVFRHTKTIQFQERSLHIPLPRKPGSIFCPVQATFLALENNTSLPMTAPVFVLPGGDALTASVFVKQIQSCLQKLGLPAHQYGGHSLRRGGASWAYRVGVDVETIRQLGDWKSLAYTNYIHANKDVLFNTLKQMQSNI